MVRQWLHVGQNNGRFYHLYVLWDGAFSHVSKVDPTEEDIVMYKQFVLAGVMSHVAEGLSVIPKVHLMWKHVEEQIRFLGGLG